MLVKHRDIRTHGLHDVRAQRQEIQSGYSIAQCWTQSLTQLVVRDVE